MLMMEEKWAVAERFSNFIFLWNRLMISVLGNLDPRMIAGLRGWLFTMSSHTCLVLKGNMHMPLSFSYKKPNMNISLSRSSIMKIYLFCNIKGWLSFRKQILSTKYFVTVLWCFIHRLCMSQNYCANSGISWPF